MTKAELSKAWQEAAEKELERTYSKHEMDTMLALLGSIIAAELLGGGEIPLPGLGKLKVKDVPARTGRNPGTGEQIQIPAKRKPVFVAGKELKDSLN